MHNAAAEALGLNWAYVALPVPPEEIGPAIHGLAALGFLGANVTVPHKQAVMPYLDGISPAARAIGAVNTIVVNRPGQGDLWGDNTDWRGFLDDLATQGVDVSGRDCLVLGAGGSARAVVYGLHHARARVIVLARSVSQATELLADLDLGATAQAASLSSLAQVAPRLAAPLIVNTSPVGMSPLNTESIWPDDLPFPRGAFVYDLVYNPRQTQLMRQAQAAGCAHSNGLGMLLRQGALAFTLWSAQTPDIEVMRYALEKVAGAS